MDCASYENTRLGLCISLVSETLGYAYRFRYLEKCEFRTMDLADFRKYLNRFHNMACAVVRWMSLAKKKKKKAYYHTLLTLLSRKLLGSTNSNMAVVINSRGANNQKLLFAPSFNEKTLKMLENKDFLNINTSPNPSPDQNQK